MSIYKKRVRMFRSKLLVALCAMLVSGTGNSGFQFYEDVSAILDSKEMPKNVLVLASPRQFEKAALTAGIEQDLENINKVFAAERGRSFTLREARALIENFVRVDCVKSDAVRIVWFTGQVDAELIPETPALLFATAPPKSGEMPTQANLSLSELFASVASSNCRFLVGVDADPAAQKIPVPQNVTVIWANSLGFNALDTPEGGQLTNAFLSAIKGQEVGKKWTAKALEMAIVKELALRPPVLFRGQASMPWVQSANRDAVFVLPSLQKPKLIKRTTYYPAPRDKPINYR
jgi:hypothetical protein